MTFATRSLSPRESRIVLAMAEHGNKEIERREIIDRLGVSPQAADQVIRSLRRKGWLERACWGRYLLIPPEMGPDALGESNVLALASRIAEPYYFGYGTAARYYGFTTQHRQVLRLVTPVRKRNRSVLDTEVRIVNPVPRKFFGFGPVHVLGHAVMMSDREKTAIDCVDRPDLAGGYGEAAIILATACRGIDWHKAVSYLGPVNSNGQYRGILGEWNSPQLNTNGSRPFYRCSAVMSNCPTSRCSTPSCMSPSMVASGAGCRHISATGTPSTPG